MASVNKVIILGNLAGVLRPVFPETTFKSLR